MRWKRSLLKKFVRDQSGVAMAFFVLTVPALLGIAAFTVDLGLAHLAANRIQIVADVSALAGASGLPNPTTVENRAREFAVANEGDKFIEKVEVGNWDSADKVFTPAALPTNAVRVTMLRSAETDTALPAVFGVILGHSTYAMTRWAVAISTPEDCLMTGMVANLKIVMGSANTMNGVCAHGQQGAQIGSDNVFIDAELSMRDIRQLQQGSKNVGLDEALAERDLSPVDALNIVNILNDFEAGRGPWPPYLDGTISTVSSLPSSPVKGRLYIVSNDVTLSGTRSGFGVFSKKKITMSSDARLSNMFLAARDNVEAGSNIRFGSLDYCTTGDGSVFMASQKEVKLGSNNSFNGVQILAGAAEAGKGVDMGSNLDNIAGLAVQSAGDIKLGSAQVSECDQDHHVLMGGGDRVVRLVQ